MRELVIGDHRIADDSDCFVIAEIGHNHQGSLELAVEMFKAARECGVDAVKLQKRSNRALYTREMYESPYDNENSFGATYGAHREALEFGRDEYRELVKVAGELGLVMFATVWDLESADFLAELDMPAYKIASGDITSTPLLEYVARLGKPMIVSTGGATMDDVRRACDTILPLNSRLCLMQCTATYPTDPSEMNLRVISTMRETFPDVVVGLSDHQSGIAMALVAYMLGARVMEKHFTLNRASKGTDHSFSLEPVGMKKMVRDLRRARVALGDGEKRRLPAEEKPLYKMGKMLVAARDLEEGHVVSREDLAMKSPAGGLFPYEIGKVVGRRLARPLKADEKVTFDALR